MKINAGVNSNHPVILALIFNNLLIFLPGLPGQPCIFYPSIYTYDSALFILLFWYKAIILFCLVNVGFNPVLTQITYNVSITEKVFVRNSAKWQHVLKIDIDL